MRRRLVAAGAALLIIAAALTQVLVPPIAESRVRDELRTFGEVTSVRVSSTPAVKLLFGAVDQVRVMMNAATFDSHIDPAIVERAKSVDEMELSIDELTAGPIAATGVSMNKDGDKLEISGNLDAKDLEAFLPGATMKVEDGVIVLELSPAGLPVPGPVQFEITVDSGRVVARPRGILAAILPPQPLLDRPEFAVKGLQAQLHGGQLAVSANATLTGS